MSKKFFIMASFENEIKLDYKDVLLKPKRSTARSRKEVDLFRSLDFRIDYSEGFIQERR